MPRAKPALKIVPNNGTNDNRLKEESDRSLEEAIAEAEAHCAAVVAGKKVAGNSYRLDVANWRSVDLMNPPGLAGEIVDAIEARNMRPLRWAAIPAALQLMAIAAGIGKRKSLNGAKMNIITITIAESAAGKDAAQSFISDVLLRISKTAHLFNRPRTDKDMIMNALDADGKALYVVDEAHDLIGSINNKGSSQYTKSIGPLILAMATAKLYTLSGTHKREVNALINTAREKAVKRLERIDKQIDADESNKDLHKARTGLVKQLATLDVQQTIVDTGIKDPLVCLMLSSTPGNFEKVIDYGNIASGLIGRGLLFHCGDEAARSRADEINVDSTVADALADRVRDLTTYGRSLKVQPNTRAFLKTIFEYLEDDDRRNAPIVGALYRRAYERVISIASLLATDEGEVTDEHVKYAFALVMRNIEDVTRLSQQNEIEDIQTALQQRVIDVIKHSPVGVKFSAINKQIMRRSVFAEAAERARINGYKDPLALAIAALERQRVIECAEIKNGLNIRLLRRA
ncbi:hypothetical protein [Citrobacter youngae]|uniref:hypothetical protein n=1 Tax=Citrobacter youngae TaxID=133448 RepID=UPI00397D7D64